MITFNKILNFLKANSEKFFSIVAYALTKTIDEIRLRYGKNSVLRASSYLDHSTARYRNGLIGGHKK